MTNRLGWVVAVALGTLPGLAQAQAKMQHGAATANAPAATSTTAAPTANVSDVVWLRQRVEQLESQLAAGGGRCSPETKSKMKRNKDSAMPAGSMGDKPMGDKPMGDKPMGDKPMEGDM